MQLNLFENDEMNDAELPRADYAIDVRTFSETRKFPDRKILASDWTGIPAADIYRFTPGWYAALP